IVRRKKRASSPPANPLGKSFPSIPHTGIQKCQSTYSSAPPHSLRHPDKLGDDLVDPLRNLGIDELVAVKRITGSINESRNDETAEIEHKTIGEAHDRHVTAHPAGRAKKSDYFVFPGTSGKLDHVLGRGGHIVVVNRRSDDDSIGFFNCGS